jgi:glycosidase
VLSGLYSVAPAAAQEWPPAAPLPVPAEADPGPLPPSVSAAPAEGGLWRVTFRYQPGESVGSLVLAGSFNDWSREAHRFSGPDGSGTWQVELFLHSGRHLYKFVADGERWITDPLNPDGEPDGYGGRNSLLRLGRLAHLDESPARSGDGQIAAVALEHRPDLPMYFQWLSPDRALVRYRTLAGDVERVEAVTASGGRALMRYVWRSPLFSVYEAELPVAPGRAELGFHGVSYTFVLTDGEMRGCDPQVYHATFSETQVFSTPEWARHAVWYQIMLDRFRNGRRDNDPSPVRPWTSEWFTLSPWEEQSGESFYRHCVFRRLYGGDLDGLEEKLGYLKDLGVNALYLNPIFVADTHHKYNAATYLHVDPHYGVGAADDYAQIAAQEDPLDSRTWRWTKSDRRFLEFLRKARTMGFRVILDGVFNHVGVAHPAFQDVRKNGPRSRFADWFEIRSWEPFEYAGWAGVRDLPAFRKSMTGLVSPTLTRHIYEVTRRWMDPDGDGDPRDGIDGWRLDVPNELPHEFWIEWRRHVKSINPEAYIVGEIWDRADLWLDGRHFDAVMNYPFARAAVAWIIDTQPGFKIPPSEIDRRLAELRLAYPAAATYVLQNLIGSHDTDRVASMAQNPNRPYDRRNRVQDDNPGYDNSRPSEESYRRARLIALLQMTYVGAPLIYYGDEVGMWGADDPTCRKPMLWEDLQPYEKPEENFVMKDHLEFYRAAIALRHAHPALRSGSFETLLTDDAADVWAFLRADERERLVVALNASQSSRSVRIPVPGGDRTWSVVFGAPPGQVPARGGVVELTLGPLSGLVLHSAAR